MADAKLKIVIDAVNNASGELKKVQGDIQGVGRAAKPAAGGLGNVVGALAGMGVAAAAVKLVRVAKELEQIGAASEHARGSLEAVAGGARQADEALEAMRTASQGTMSELEMMKSATILTAMGFADSADQMANIARNVTALGASFGGTMQVFQLMMSQNSLMRIDSFGIGVEEATERINEFKEAGMSADQAFDTAILELMNEKFEEMGGVLQDTQLEVNQTKAAWQDFTASVGASVIKGTSEARGVWTKFIQWMTNGQKILNAEREKEGFIAGTVTGNLKGLMQAEEDIYGVMRIVTRDSEAMMLQQEATAEMWDQYSTAVSGAYAAMEKYGKYDSAPGLMHEEAIEIIYANEAARDAAASFEWMTRAVQDSRTASDNYTLERLRAEATDARIAFDGAAAALDEMSGKQFAYNLIEQYRQMNLPAAEFETIQRKILEEFGLLTPAEVAAQEALNNIAAGYDGTANSASMAAYQARMVNEELNRTPAMKQVVIRIDEYRTTYINPQQQLDDFNQWAGQNPGGGWEQNNKKATGGQFWTTHPTRLTVGEGGQPELVTVTPATQVSNTWNVNFQGMNSQGAVGAVRMLQALYGAR